MYNRSALENGFRARQEKEQILDREIREREIRESEQHYEEVTAKRNSRLRAQMSYETGYETQLTPEESAAEQLRYVVTEEEARAKAVGRDGRRCVGKGRFKGAAGGGRRFRPEGAARDDRNERGRAAP